MCDFCLPAGRNPGRAALKVEQKPEEMPDFCLPAGRNSGCEASEVDKNLGKCVIFVYRLVEIQGARPQK